MAIKRMLIDASHPEETRVAVVSGTRLEDFDVEVESRRPLKGNIYLAKVTRVEPSLQAAFVDYGGNRHGFLSFSEIHPDYYQIPVADRQALIAEEEEAQREVADSDNGEESPNGDGDADNGNGDGDGKGVETLGGDEIDEEQDRRRPTLNYRRYKIQEVIKRRQILLIQVVKEERGTKGAALTTYLSLAGRYCVLMPNTARGGGISRKISSGQDRKRLKSMLSGLGIPDGMAVIVRTAGSKRSKAEIKRDYEYLIRLWSQIRDTTLDSIAPCLIHEEGNLVKRSIRDLYDKDTEEIIVDGEESYKAAKAFMKLLIPSHAKKVQPYKDEGVPLMQRYQIEGQLDAIHSPEVHMKSGGYIVINPTEALVSIDVNSGKSTKERNIEETALKTNMEAAEEIARQLKLRDLAGLIVIDFIDMEVHRNQSKVERVMKEAMRFDRARIQIGHISPFGLLEMSRQRLRPSLIETSSEPCPHCGGTGVRRSTDSTALQVLRMIEEEGLKKRAEEIHVHVPTAVALYILNQKRKTLADIEAQHAFTVLLQADDSLIPPDCRIERVRGEGLANEIVDPRAEQSTGQSSGQSAGQSSGRSSGRTAAGSSGASSDAPGEEGKGKRRRRGRRKKRDEDDREEVVAVDANETGASVASENEGTGDESRVANPANDTGDVDTDDADKPKRRRRGRRGGRRRGRKPGEETANGETTVAADAGAGDAPVELLDGPAAVDLLPPPSSDAIPMPDGSTEQPTIALPDDSDGEQAEPAPAKRPRARRAPRKKAVVTSDASDDTSANDETPAEGVADAEAKPKRPRRRATKAAVAADASEPTTSDTPPVVPPEPEPVSAAIIADPPLVAAVETETTAEADTDADAASKTIVVNIDAIPKEEQPARRGWWRR